MAEKRFRVLVDREEHGYAPTLPNAMIVALAVAMRHLRDIDIVDPNGKRVARIGEEIKPPRDEQAPLYLLTEVDRDEDLLVHFESNLDDVEVDLGDGTGMTLRHANERESHAYGRPGTYHVLATAGEERRESWVSLALKPNPMPTPEEVKQ